MRRNYDLYINGAKADVSTDALVLMNYKQTDASSPAAVYNNWSQQLALPRTSKNNTIFDHIYRADHKTVSGKFNSLQRTPFEIISETGEKLEAGYLKLTDISDTQYSVVLYGGLGGFLFSLMYNADGSEKSLADLQYYDYPYGGDDELTFTITRDAVREAWRTIAGLEAHSDLWDIINFAPCYNGIPGGEFDPKKAFCYDQCYGVTDENGSYKSNRRHVMVNLVNEVDEWAAQDLRSYQQRPVIRVKAIFDALQRFATAARYTLNLDASFFNSSNPYYWKTWLTLPKLDSIQLPNESGSGHGTVSGPDPGAEPTYYPAQRVDTEIAGPWTGKNFSTKYDVTVNLVPTVLGSSQNTAATAAWVDNIDAYHRVVTVYQLYALDKDGVIIGGSKVAMATTKTKAYSGMTVRESTVTPARFIEKYNNPTYAPVHNTFTPAWTPQDGDTYDAQMYNGEMYMNTMNGRQLVDENYDPIEVTLSFEGVAGVARVMLRTTYLAIFSPDENSDPYYQQSDTDKMANLNASATMTFTSLSFNAASDDYEYSISGTAHSGAEITKHTLLGATKTPADYLLSYAKMFGLCFRFDNASKTVDLMTRDSWFGLAANPVNLQDRIDITTRKVVPYVIESRWYDFLQEAESRFADYYKSVYGRDYGLARVNTGFEFDASHTDVLEGSAFRGAAEVLKQSKYFTRISQASKPCPSVFVDGGSYTLWNATNEGEDHDVNIPSAAAAIEYVNTLYPGYDYRYLAKPEFCDKDGKEVDGDNVLLFYNFSLGTGYYNRYTLTDDNGLMTLYNEGKPCWLLGQSAILSNDLYTINDGDDSEKKLYIPSFTRMLTTARTATDSLDMGVPQEIDNPDLTAAASIAVYPRRWASYISDRMDQDSKVMTCKVNLKGFQVGPDMLRRFYYFDGSLWVMNSIKNYILGGDELTECELVKISDKTNYNNGQTT